jgi:hypothetical protein
MLRFLRAFLTFAARSRWSAPPEWTEADARALATFLGSSSGAKLRAILHSEIATANERAAMSGGATPAKTAFDCGWACGYRGLYAWFESLSARPAAEPGELEEAA